MKLLELIINEIAENKSKGAIYKYDELYGCVIYDISGNDLHIDIHKIGTDNDFLVQDIGLFSALFWKLSIAGRKCDDIGFLNIRPDNNHNVELE